MNLVSTVDTNTFIHIPYWGKGPKVLNLSRVWKIEYSEYNKEPSRYRLLLSHDNSAYSRSSYHTYIHNKAEELNVDGTYEHGDMLEPGVFSEMVKELLGGLNGTNRHFIGHKPFLVVKGMQGWEGFNMDYLVSAEMSNSETLRLEFMNDYDQWYSTGNYSDKVKDLDMYVHLELEDFNILKHLVKLA